MTKHRFKDALRPPCKYDAFAIRRHIRHLGVLPGNIYQFAMYSMTRAGKQTEHHIDIDLQTGQAQCGCEHFRFRHAAAGANIVQWLEGEKPAPCKHLQRATEWLYTRGHLSHMIVYLRPCQCCGVAEAEHEMADDNGNPLPAFICADCVKRAQRAGEPDRYEGFDEWLASHRTDEDIHAEAEYFAQQRTADEFADFVEAQAEAEAAPPCLYCNRALDVIQTETGGEAFVCSEHGEMPHGYDPNSGRVISYGRYE